MGLFGGLLKGVAQVFSPIGGAIIGGHDNKKAIGKANDATQLGYTNAGNALTDQLATSTQNFDPYASNGGLAIGQEGDILGLHGNDAQGSAIDAIKASPFFTSLFDTGRDSILAAGSATGGLRGGNVNDALYKNGQQTLAQAIQQQLLGLGGIAGQGLSATTSLANLGAGTAAGVAGLDTASGEANAGAILGKQAVNNNTIASIQKLIASAVSGGAGGIGGAALTGGLPF